MAKKEKTRFSMVPKNFKQKYRVVWQAPGEDTIHKKYFMADEYRKALGFYMSLVSEQSITLTRVELVALDGVAEIVGQSSPQWIPYFESYSHMAKAVD